MDANDMSIIKIGSMYLVSLLSLYRFILNMWS